MRIVSNAYQHLGRFLKDSVLDDDGRPAFNWVDLWYEQTEYPELAEAIDYPALFFDFGSDDLNTVGLKEQDVRLITNLYVAVSTLQDTNLESVERNEALHYFELCARVHELLQGYAHPAVGNLDRIGFSPVSTNTNLIVYRLTYASRIFDISPLVKREGPNPGPEPTKLFDV
ncbi:hypothetical protein [Hymenobacter rubripertinctus]|uniref:Uncharacterized protein n=1 Tax=Hymenobacter rubripertinctus TaxID=2029981 RepID=A0A418QMP7_9BACT|nr:hypothetical protein [Hymenobacter rubripertinctus]RIY06475.1 hypothetical protein D0T11_18720 [Hymenobacter rubripertinctus]